MSDAKVKFELLDHEPAGENDTPVRFGFACPLHKGRRCEGLLIVGDHGIKRDPQGKNGGVAQWDWNGDRAAPTFHPSINCGGCWHGYIEKGRCVSVSKADEPELA